MPRMPEHFLGRAVEKKSSPIEEDDPVCDRCGEADLVRDNDHGHALGRKGPHDVEHLSGEFRIE